MRVADARTRKVKKIRSKIAALGAYRLTVFRTPKHIYAQIFTPCGSAVLTAASSLESAVKSEVLGPGKIKTAEMVGRLIAERSLSKAIQKVAFDRAGFKYHGRIKALAEAARAAGLKF